MRNLMRGGRRRTVAALTAVVAWLGAQAPVAAKDPDPGALAQMCDATPPSVAWGEVADACDGLLMSDLPLNDAVRALIFTKGGNAKLNQGRLEEAIWDLGSAIRLAPQAPAAYNLRAAARVITEDYDGAVADAGRAIELQPQQAVPYYVRSQAHLALKNHDRAIADVNRAIELEPGEAVSYYIRSQVYLALKNHDRAIADADQAAGLEPDNAGYQNERCWARAVANRDLAVARAVCDKAQQLQPGEAAILDSRGLVGLRQGRFREAWTDYDAAVRLDPDSADYRYGRGVSALRLGRTSDGQADIAAALDLDPQIAQTYADMGVTP